MLLEKGKNKIRISSQVHIYLVKSYNKPEKGFDMPEYNKVTMSLEAISDWLIEVHVDCMPLIFQISMLTILIS